MVDATRELTRTHWTAQKLDAIYLRAEVPFTSRAWALNVKASDHLPVFVEAEFNERA
jgi:endonuclease/exonuclease/phosphatase family metal-dependent hydrolase